MILETIFITSLLLSKTSEATCRFEVESAKFGIILNYPKFAVIANPLINYKIKRYDFRIFQEIMEKSLAFPCFFISGALAHCDLHRMCLGREKRMLANVLLIKNLRDSNFS